MNKNRLKKRFRYITVRCMALVAVFGVLLLFLFVMMTLANIYDRDIERYFWIFFIFFAVFAYAGYRFIYQPYKETNKVLKLFSEGYLIQGLFEMRCPLSPEFERMTHKFRDMLNTQEMISVTKKQAEYLALQTQINPHFLYNTLEGIRSEALYADMESIAQMTEALATFFRYTISNVENLVTLEDELANIDNYYIIQQYRFGDRLSYTVDIDADEEMEILKYQLPKLTLQPIVENSIYHGIERKVGKGNLRIKVEETKDRLLVTISDDGLGMPEEQVDQINKKLRVTSLEDVQPQTDKKQSIAIGNVNNRIKLLFGDLYGITIYSTLGAGTDVVITLPLIRD